MFKDEFAAVCGAGKNKLAFMEKNMLGFMVSALVAGMFISFGSFVAFTLGAGLAAANYPLVKAAQAFAFAAALSLVVGAGAELFTGNNFVMAAASFRKDIPWMKTVKLWVVCYIGNWVGSIALVLIFQLTSIPKGPIGEYFATLAAAKMGLSVLEMFTRSILCNILVCLAVWCSIKMKSESGKMIMIFWCIFVFMVCGFEHSVANMSTLLVGVLNATDPAVSMGGYFYNIFFVTIGNMIGGIIGVALPYYLIAKEK